MKIDHGLSARQLEAMRQILAPFVEAIERVDLFGSRANGKYRPNSDLDLVIHGSLSQKTVDQLGTLFKESSLPFTVDVKSYELTHYAPLKAHMDKVACTLFIKSDLSEPIRREAPTPCPQEQGSE